MQVLLRENVPALGRRGEIVRVKDGYARNYLMPRGLAMAVDQGALKTIEQEQKRLQKIADKERMEAQALADRISGATVALTAKANEEGVLFGSVGPDEIAAKLAADVAPVEASMVRMTEHIKNVGEYDVTVHVAHDVDAVLKVVVAAEGAAEGQAGAQPQPQQQ
jgi:large subunit ribosomal protein L9